MIRRDTGDPELIIEEIRTADLTLGFLPGVGGRLISIQAGGQEYLWRNPEFLDAELQSRKPRSSWPTVDGTFESWANIGGSKTWPAPQGWSGAGEWAGPPDDVLDSGEWSTELHSDPDGSSRYVMQSPHDPRTGLSIRRSFDIPAAGQEFVQQIEFRNTSAWAITWAIWEVCQIDVAPGAGDPRSAIVVASDAVPEPVRLGDYVGEIGWEQQGDSLRVPVQDVVGKLGFPAATGAIGWFGPRGEGVSMEFTVDADAQYPDQGSRAEVWMQSPQEEPIAELSGLHPRDRVAELEVLGPLTTLAPGESSTLTIHWRIRSPQR